MVSAPRAPISAAHALATPRLILRAPRQEDADQFLEAVEESFDTHHYWLNWREKPSRAAVEENLKKAAREFGAVESLRYHAFLREENRFVGRVGFYIIDWAIPKFEIGYWCRGSMKGRGLLREAVRELMNYGFSELHAARIEIRCNSRNLEARNLAEKMLFSLDATLKNNERDLNGALVDTCVYSKLPE